MDTWNAKYRNKWNEYEVKFCSDDYEKAKTVERVCQYIMDGEITSRSDVAPVLQGEWEVTDWVEPDGHGFGMIRFPNGGFRCSRCVNVFRKELLWKKNYCPNCGAKMEVQNG